MKLTLKEFLNKFTYVRNIVDENIKLHRELDDLKNERKRLLFNTQQLSDENNHLIMGTTSLSQDLKITQSNILAKAGSARFWDDHYRNGFNSGTGSYCKLAQFKADTLNSIIDEYGINETIELGCGDGNQLGMISYKHYTGVDVSEYIIENNKNLYNNDSLKHFYHTSQRDLYFKNKYNLALSMDVIFHLLEENVFHSYINDLFALSNNIVIIYSSNHEEYTQWPEFRHRNFTHYIENNITGWKLEKYIPNKYPYFIGKESETSSSDFYIYKMI